MPLTDTITPMSQRVLARLPGAPLEIVNIEMRAATTEFLARSLIWRSRKTFPLVANTNGYTIVSPQEPAGVMIASVLAAFCGKTPMRVGPLTGYDFTTTGDPRVVDSTNPTQVIVWPTPTTESAGKEIALDVAWGLDPSSIEPDSVILPYNVLGHLEVMVDGALARLYAMPDKPWSSTQHAEYHLRRFRGGTMEARRTADTGRGREGLNPPSWRFPPFA